MGSNVMNKFLGDSASLCMKVFFDVFVPFLQKQKNALKNVVFRDVAPRDSCGNRTTVHTKATQRHIPEN